MQEDLQQHYVVVRLGHLGDVILCTGVLRYWGESVGARFTVLTKKAWAPVFEKHPYVQNVLVFEHECPENAPLFACLNALASQYKGVPLIDLHGTLRTRLLRLAWQGKTYAYPKKSIARRAFVASKGRLGGSALQLSVPQRYVQALPQVFVPSADTLLPQLWLSKEEKDQGRQLAFRYGAKPVAIHPFASHAGKTWKKEVWHMFTRLLDDNAIPWLAIGVGEDIFAGSGRSAINMLDLRESAALLSCCQALVTGDSGPMHLAGAVGTPVVSFFGPTTREWGFYPQGSRDVVLELPLQCRPCSLHGRGECSLAGGCLQGISPEMVFEAVMRLRDCEAAAEE